MQRRYGGRVRSPGTASVRQQSKSRPGRRCGIPTGPRPYRSVGCWCATRRGAVHRWHCSALTRPPRLSTSWPGTWTAGHIETTFEEVRAHLGLETQREWSTRSRGPGRPVCAGALQCGGASRSGRAPAGAADSARGVVSQERGNIHRRPRCGAPASLAEPESTTPGPSCWSGQFSPDVRSTCFVEAVCYAA